MTTRDRWCGVVWGGVGLCAAGLITTPLCGRPCVAGELDHILWEQLLQRYVDDEGRVAYRDLREHDRSTLDRYLALLAKAAPQDGADAAAKAFWINAAGSVATFAECYVDDAAQRDVLRARADSLDSLAYDWTMNAREGQRP